jgi:hypothetical protein
MGHTWHGHSASKMEAGEARFLIDQFPSDDRHNGDRSSSYLTGKKGGNQ